MRMTVRKLMFVLLIATVAVGVGCYQQSAPPPDTRAQDEAAIRALVAEWSKAAQARDVEKFISYYAADGSLLAPGAPIATGKDALRKVVEQLMATPDINISFGPTKVEVARSGDIAYEMGTYEESAKDAKGKPYTTKGKYVVAWKKQADGSWKVMADIFNPDS